MLTLYGSKGSGSAAIEAALAVAGVPYEHVDGAEWNRTEGYEQLKRVNPLAQIPTLVLEDGSVLSESAAILIHLGLAHPESGLLAADPSRRAQQIRGLVYIVANCYAGDRHPRLSRALVPGARRRRAQGDGRSAAEPACTSCGTSSSTSSRRRRG